MRIADADALPLNDAFDWPALSGIQAPGYKPYPAYNPTAPNAAAQGRKLVERVSEDLAQDEDGSLAQWLSKHLQKNASYVTVLTDAAPKAVDDGWYLLTAPGRRPLFAWVDGDLVTLGDKSDTPVLDKEVSSVDGWGDSSVGGSGQAFSYRTSITVPHTFELYSTYKLSMHDTHDERLTLDAQSLKVELLRSADAAAQGEDAFEVVADLTKDTVLETAGASFTVTIANLKATPARPGDVVRVSYRMTVDSLAAPGAEGLVNDAFATFPGMGGEEETPHDATRVYLIRPSVHKINEQGAALEGARFAVRDAQGSWLSESGSFGALANRAEFTSSRDGMVESIPALAPGRYELVELAAPKGYVLPADPAFSFEVSATSSLEDLSFEVEAVKPLTVERVSGPDGSFTLSLTNVAEDAPGGFMPQTGDAPWATAAVLLVSAGVVLVALGKRRQSQGTK